MLFDTSEPNKYKSDSQELISSSPTFSTGKELFLKKENEEKEIFV